MSAAIESTNLAASLVAVILAIVVGRTAISLRGTRWGRITTLGTLVLAVWAADRLAAPDPVLGYAPVVDAITDVCMAGLLVALLLESVHWARGSVHDARRKLLMIETAAAHIEGSPASRANQRNVDVISGLAREVRRDLAGLAPTPQEDAPATVARRFLRARGAGPEPEAEP